MFFQIAFVREFLMANVALVRLDFLVEKSNVSIDVVLEVVYFIAALPGAFVDRSLRCFFGPLFLLILVFLNLPFV